MRPRLLDLFCGAGGAGMGYALAGFDVVGVDVAEQPSYPFEFVQADALTFPLEGFDAVHASPPCQAFAATRVLWNARAHADLLTPTRARLLEWGGPYVIENVPGAPMRDAIRLCGTAFGLGVARYGRELRRHRLFESNLPLLALPCQHRRPTIGVYGDHARDRRRVELSSQRGVDFPDAEKLELAREALGMPWAERWDELRQAIPPAYTEHIGWQLLEHAARRAA